MGQIIGGAAKPKRCNLNKLSQLEIPTAGEHILVSSDNSMNAAGQGNFDCYIVGDGKTAATALPLIKTYANDVDNEPTAGSKKLVKSGGVFNPLYILDNFKNNIADYYQPTNLYNKSSVLNKDNVKVSTTGDYSSLNGSSVSHPIKVEAGKTYTFKYSPGFYGVAANRIVRFCDKNGAIISEFGSAFILATDNGTESGTFTITEDHINRFSQYVCVNVRTIDKNVMIFAEGNSLPSYSDYFEPYWKIKSSALTDIIDRTLSVSGKAAEAKAVGDYRDAISEYRVPVNLFNKDSELIKTGYRIRYSGDYTTISGGSVTHPIKVEVGKTYCFKPYLSFYGDAANKIVRVCDENGVLSIYGFSATLSSDNSYYLFTFDETMRQYGEYVCVNVRTSEIGNMIFAEGNSLPSYSDYFEPYWAIKSSALPSDMPLPLNVGVNPLYGKKAAFTGDSICYGQGASGGYAKIIGEKNNMTISNIGVAGGTLCSGTNRFCISASVDNMPEDYDYYIVEGGVNDASQEHGETLGTLSSGYNATLNTATLYGAMEYLCKQLQLNFKGKKYGFIFPHNTYGDTSAWNTGWRDAMKICLKKWGIPYLDLSEECAQLRNLDALRIYTSNGDGWHPTEDGYKLYYVPKIEAWMKTL